MPDERLRIILGYTVGFLLIGLAYWKGSWPVVAGVVVLLFGAYWLFWRQVVRKRMRRR